MQLSRRAAIGVAIQCGVSAWTSRAPCDDVSDALRAPNALDTVKSFPHCVAFAPDGKTLAIGTATGVDLWDVALKKRTASLPTKDTIFSADFSSDGSKIAGGTGVVTRHAELNKGQGSIIVWDVKSAKEQAKVGRDKETLIGVGFTHGAAHVVAGGDRIILYDTATLQSRVELDDLQGPFTLISGGTMLLARETNESLVIFALEKRRVARRIKGSIVYDWLRRRALTSSFDGQYLAWAHDDEITVYESAAGKVIDTIIAPAKKADAGILAFSPSGKILAIAGSSSRIVLWDVVGRKIAASYESKLPRILDIAFSPDGKQIVSIGAHYFTDGPNEFAGVVEMWDVPLAAINK